MTSDLVIQTTPTDMHFALLEDKQLVELSKEKKNNRFSVGDIYLGKVRKIMPGLNAAFVDVGYERDAFLHYLDLGPQFKTQAEYLKAILGKKMATYSLDVVPSLPDIDKRGKISDVMTEGQIILVQVAKEPISTKGPRITSELSLAGRNLVLMPFSNKISISHKIKGKEERDRLKDLIQSIKPNNYGVIVRTMAKNRRVSSLDSELRELIERWENAMSTLIGKAIPQLVIGEINRASAILRDMLNNEFNNIFVDNSEIFKEVRDYISSISPEQEKIVKLYSGNITIFEHYGVDKQIKSLFGRTVTFKNGAYLIIEHTEALHVIDVNSGNRTKSSMDQEANALEVNLAAAEEIARQLRLRDMGGIIVIDFIDMITGENKMALFEHMKKLMAAHRTKHTILPLTKFGLMQITRQRVRPELNIETSETCPTCGGSGEIVPSILLFDEIENNLKYILDRKAYKNITIKLHPYIGSYLTKGWLSIRLKWMIRYKLWIKVITTFSVTFNEYHFQDEDGEEIVV